MNATTPPPDVALAKSIAAVLMQAGHIGVPHSDAWPKDALAVAKPTLIAESRLRTGSVQVLAEIGPLTADLTEQETAGCRLILAASIGGLTAQFGEVGEILRRDASGSHQS